jgi:cystathionine beta-lyase
MKSFDELINFKLYNSSKWRGLSNNKSIAMSLADMDFRCAKEIIDTLICKVSSGIYGYKYIDYSYFESIQYWFKKRHFINLDQSNIIPHSGTLHAISTLIKTFSETGDGVIIQPPVYYYFKKLIVGNSRKLMNNNLLLNESSKRYNINYNELEKFAKLGAKILILCSPHNPVGRIWNRAELYKVAKFCLENRIILISDEIHCDILMDSKKFFSVANLDYELKNNIIILNSPTKTFNFPALKGGNLIVFNSTLKKRIISAFEANCNDKFNFLYIEACKVAYLRAEYWVDEVSKYIFNNYCYVKEFIKQNNINLQIHELEATYLLWVSFKKLCLKDENFYQMLGNDLILARGYEFGLNGSGFFRMNIACPIDRLKKSLNILRLKVNLIK